MSNAITSFVFAIKQWGFMEYWTGRTDREGRLERSAHRADAYKFSTSRSALECADTHDELRDSMAWRLVPMRLVPKQDKRTTGVAA